MQRFEQLMTIVEPSWAHSVFVFLKWTDHHVARPFGWIAMAVCIIALFRGRRWLVRLVIRWTGRVLKLRKRAKTQLVQIIRQELFPSDMEGGAEAWVSLPNDFFTSRGGDQRKQ